ncbi:sensor histidine kinase [Patescibacteria group bacterium]
MVKRNKKVFWGIFVLLFLTTAVWAADLFILAGKTIDRTSVFHLIYVPFLFLAWLLFLLWNITHHREKLKQAQEAKTKFVSLVAHQLRTPVTRMRWITEEMLEQKRLPSGIRSQLKELHDMVLAENMLVGDLLNVSRIERGVIKVRNKKVKVNQLLKEIIEPFRGSAKEHQIRLKLKPTKSTLSLNTDPEKLKEAVQNIIDNAIKYSQAKSSVVVGVEDEHGAILFYVKDEGPGIPDDIQDVCFEIKTAENVQKTECGTGLGLYLTRMFINALKGSVWFDSSSKGTTFYISLPKHGKRG